MAKTKKNPVAVEEGRLLNPDILPKDVFDELMQLDVEDGRFVFVSSETYEYFQDDNIQSGLTHGTEIFGLMETQMLDLLESDGKYKVKIPLRLR